MIFVHSDALNDSTLFAPSIPRVDRIGNTLNKQCCVLVVGLSYVSMQTMEPIMGNYPGRNDDGVTQKWTAFVRPLNIFKSFMIQ